MKWIKCPSWRNSLKDLLGYLHHETSESFALNLLFQLDLVDVEDLVVEVHVVAEVGESEQLPVVLLFGDQVPRVVVQHLLLLVGLLPAPLALLVHGLHVSRDQVHEPDLKKHQVEAVEIIEVIDIGLVEMWPIDFPSNV